MTFLSYTWTLMLCGLLFCLTSLSACSRYAVSLNNKVLYTPPKLFTAYQVADKDLNACLKSNIIEGNITAAPELKRLFCPGGNINKLSGIEQFPSIEYLGLKANNIENMLPLKALKHLKQLDISHNAVRDFSPLKDLNSLNLLNAEKNPRARCDSLTWGTRINKLTLPRHCKN